MGKVGVRGEGQQIGEYKTISADGFSHYYIYRILKHGPIE